MIASSSRTELNTILTHFPDVAMSPITYEAAYCRLTSKVTGAPLAARPVDCRVGRESLVDVEDVHLGQPFTVRLAFEDADRIS